MVGSIVVRSVDSEVKYVELATAVDSDLVVIIAGIEVDAYAAGDVEPDFPEDENSTIVDMGKEVVAADEVESETTEDDIASETKEDKSGDVL